MSDEGNGTRSHEVTAAPEPVGPSRRILMVDDNRDAANSLAALLRLRGHDVMVAHDGKRALDITRAHRPSFVLLDIGLPEIDGYELCRRVREQGLDDAQIIAMTGYGQESDRQRAKEAGFDQHMVKSVDLGEVIRLLAQQ